MIGPTWSPEETRRNTYCLIILLVNCGYIGRYDFSRLYELVFSELYQFSASCTLEFTDEIYSLGFMTRDSYNAFVEAYLFFEEHRFDA